MKAKSNWTVIVMAASLSLLACASFVAQEAKSQTIKEDVALRAAIERETVQGDLKGAIEQYKKLAQSKDRSIAARALVRMAEAYQKLGDSESRKIYEQIVRDYADQKEAAATARAHLGDGRWDPLESTCRHASLSIL